MITIKHPIEFPNTYPLDRIGPLKDLLFFDIETTGFSGETSHCISLAVLILTDLAGS